MELGMLLQLNSLPLPVMYGIGGILPMLALCLGHKVSSIVLRSCLTST